MPTFESAVRMLVMMYGFLTIQTILGLDWLMLVAPFVVLVVELLITNDDDKIKPA